MNNKFSFFRDKYESIIYKDYKITDEDGNLTISYTFEIPNLSIFNPTLTLNKNYIINKNINKSLLDKIVFRIGLVELISYYKCVCPKRIKVEAGFIDKEEERWYKKLFFNGLSEFFYVNKIDITEDELFDFDIRGKKIDDEDVEYEGYGNLIPVGGGKDSIVTLELLKEFDNKAFIINPKQVHYDCIDIDALTVKRTIDKRLIELNEQGYLNGHTPVSAIVAFVSYLVAYLSNRKYIVLSNEGSANESTVIGTNINHQYSKTYEFEQDFYYYTQKYFNVDIKYFSLLRPIKEIQIAKLFSKYKKYHHVFKSCNIGSKNNPWIWCCNCPKCLFIYIILSAFMPIDELVDIFGENLLDKRDLEKTFLELIGEAETKPFECVGTIEEVKFAMNRISDKDTSYLTNLYKEKYYEDIEIDLTKIYYDHNVIPEYLDILEGAIKND